MADVRLTATNPEDSSVVPVACDASGRLLLEEQGQGPPGPEGPPGPKGDDGKDGKDGKDGDPFSGNFAGDVTFGGSATFAERVDVKGGVSDDGGSSLSTGLYYRDDSGSHGLALYKNGSAQSNRNVFIKTDGSATFAGDVQFGGESYGRAQGVVIGKEGYIRATFTGNNDVWRGFAVGDETATSNISANGSAEFAGDGIFRGTLSITGDGPNNGFYVGSAGAAIIKKDGSVTFAGKKAGITPEGYLWCTTRRGDTVILDATNNGIGSWVEYTPPSRKQQIKEKLDSLREETDEMPADTQ